MGMKLDPELQRKILDQCRAELPPLADDISEKDFQQAVIGLARIEGWKVYHTYDSRKSNPGYPDLTLVRERVVWMELKVGRNKMTAEQSGWIDALMSAGMQAYCFRPEDWPAIEQILKGNQ